MNLLFASVKAWGCSVVGYMNCRTTEQVQLSDSSYIPTMSDN